MGLVEVLDQGMPCCSIAGLAAELANHPRHHALDHSLVGMIAFPPVSLSWPRPVGRVRVVRPDDAPRMKTFGDADGLVRNRVAGQHQLLAGCPKGAADSQGHRVCGPQHARRHDRATDDFDEFTTIASMSHSCLPTESSRFSATRHAKTLWNRSQAIFRWEVELGHTLAARLWAATKTTLSVSSVPLKL